MSRYDHKIESCLEGIEHLSKEKKEEKERKMKEKNHYYLTDTKKEREDVVKEGRERREERGFGRDKGRLSIGKKRRFCWS